jgi:hypothetical protein
MFSSNDMLGSINDMSVPQSYVGLTIVLCLKMLSLACL